MCLYVVHDPPAIQHHAYVLWEAEIGHQRHVAEFWTRDDPSMICEVRPQHLDALKLGALVVRKAQP